MKSVVRVGIHHATRSIAWCVAGAGESIGPTVRRLFEEGPSYRYAGAVALSPMLCAPDRMLRIAWVDTQNFDRPWREGERSTQPGDLFASGRSLYLVQEDGFSVLTNERKPKVVDAFGIPGKGNDHGVAEIALTFDNSETETLLWTGGPFDRREAVGQTREAVQAMRAAVTNRRTYQRAGASERRRRMNHETIAV